MSAAKSNPFLNAKKLAVNEPDPEALQEVVQQAPVKITEVEQAVEPKPASKNKKKPGKKASKPTPKKEAAPSPLSLTQKFKGEERVQTYVSVEVDQALKFLAKAEYRSISFIALQHLDVDAILERAKGHGFRLETDG